jgi:hypothetical protein
MDVEIMDMTGNKARKEGAGAKKRDVFSNDTRLSEQLRQSK